MSDSGQNKWTIHGFGLEQMTGDCSGYFSHHKMKCLYHQHNIGCNIMLYGFKHCVKM